MKRRKQNKRFLAKWISKDISPELLVIFQKSKDYSIYLNIIESIQKLSVVDYPFEIAYLEFKELRKSQSEQVSQ